MFFFVSKNLSALKNFRLPSVKAFGRCCDNYDLKQYVRMFISL